PTKNGQRQRGDKPAFMVKNVIYHFVHEVDNQLHKALHSSRACYCSAAGGESKNATTHETHHHTPTECVQIERPEAHIHGFLGTVRQSPSWLLEHSTVMTDITRRQFAKSHIL